MDGGDIDAAVERAREIADDEARFLESARLMQLFRRAISELADIRGDAARALRRSEEDLPRSQRVWTHERLGRDAGAEAGKEISFGQSITRQPRRKRGR